MSVAAKDSSQAAIEAFGEHPGSRLLHAKGTLLRGTFTATPAARRLTRAGHMQGEAVPVTARVSNGAGHPRSPDTGFDVRGLGVKFYLPDGSRADIVSQTAPRFPFREPGPFVEQLRLLGKPSAAWKLPVFLARHREAVPALLGGTSALRPPRSYATVKYYAIHAFRFLDADGGSRYVRYTWLPEAGVEYVKLWELRRHSRDYLQEDIARRVSSGGVRFTLEVQVAGPGDEVDNPNSVWPRDRQRVRIGTLELTGLDTEREQGDDVLVFDPGRVVEGIELSGDPVLLFRTPAYSDSVLRRSGVAPGG